MGFMPLDMPESVLVRFKGDFNPGITLRDAVNAIPYYAIKQGLLTVPKKNKVNIFNGRILRDGRAAQAHRRAGLRVDRRRRRALRRRRLHPALRGGRGHPTCVPTSP